MPWVPDSQPVELGLRIPIVSGIAWISWAVFKISKPRIPDSTTQNFPDSRFHKQKYRGFRNPNSLKRGKIRERIEVSWGRFNSRTLETTRPGVQPAFSILFSLQAVLPKLIDSVNNIINRQLSFGYDVGKGYIIAEEEIIKLIDHMVVDKRIAKDLKQRSEQNRLNVVKSLGKQARLQRYSSLPRFTFLTSATRRS